MRPPARKPIGPFGLFLALGVSMTGTSISFLAIPWFVMVTTGSATLMGLVPLSHAAGFLSLPLLIIAAGVAGSVRGAGDMAGRFLLAIALMVLLTNFLDQSFYAVLLPPWVREELGSPVALGAVSTAFGVGPWQATR